MTLWNANGEPISVKLRILPGDRFQLSVEHLDSIGGGSLGWLALEGGFRTEPLSPKVSPASTGTGATRRRLIPTFDGSSPSEAFKFDESILEPGSAFVCKMMRRLGAGGLLSAVQLEVDTAEDFLLISPRSSLVRVMWDAEVALRRTFAAWESDPGKASAGRLQGGHAR